MQVKIKRVDSTLPLPEYKTPGAVAFDFVTREETTIEPHSVARVPGNVIIETPKGFMLFVKDRGSTSYKKGLLCTAGIVDQDFCGEADEIMVQVYNFKNEPVTVERGERIAQGIFVKIETAKWEEVNTMAETSRGGWGTTG